jgi:hypothetical protein
MYDAGVKCMECGARPGYLHDESCSRVALYGLKTQVPNYFETPFGKDQAAEIYHLTDDEAVEPPALDDLVKSVTARYPEVMKRLAESEAAETKPADWRVTQLAREMCRTQGHDPDMMVVDVNNAARGPFGSVGAANTVPAWTLYLEAAGGLSGALTNG